MARHSMHENLPFDEAVPPRVSRGDLPMHAENPAAGHRGLGKGGLATYSPPLDTAGNSVRGQLATKDLAERLGLNLFASVPAQGPPPEFGSGQPVPAHLTYAIGITAGVSGIASEMYCPRMPSM